MLSETLWHETAGVSGELAVRRSLAAKEQAARKSKHYGDAAFMDEQPRLTDLIPTRLSVLAALLLAGLTVVVGLEVLYSWMPQLAPMTSDGRVAAIDLDGEGSLAVWFSSMTLAAAGLVAVVVYRVRQYRTDDYHGHYRIWLWAAMCWFLLSLDETASLHEGFKEMMAHVTGTRLMGDGSLWWVIPYFFLLGGVGTRLVVDMRECASSTVAIIGTAICYALAIAAQLGWILPEAGARGVMVEEGAEMVGNLMLLLAMTLHARHVILDAEGLLPDEKPSPPPPRRREVREIFVEEREPEEEPPVVVDHPVVVHPPHGVPRPSVAPAVAERPVIAETPAAPVHRKLTKAERKALRKRLRQMAQERERREKAG